MSAGTGLGLGLLVLALGAVPAGAAELDVSGSWQINLDCGGYATATSFITHIEDLPTGALTTTLGPPCGTVVFSGEAVAPMATCATTPSPYAGQVSGMAYRVPASGFYHVSQTLETPVFWDTFGCLVGRTEVDDRFEGAIVQSVGGVATRISGTLTVGSVGLYRPDDTLCFSLPGPFTACTFDMLRREVGAGTNVTVRPNDAVEVTFATVSSPGTVEVTPLNTAAASVPAGFQVLGSALPIFYDVTTTATVSGMITSCVSYADANADGIVDGTTIAEAGLRVLHEEGAAFVDRTSSLDTAANVVCAQTTSLSQLAPGAAESPPGPSSDTPVYGTKVVLRRNALGVERGAFLSRYCCNITPSGLPTTGATLDLLSPHEGIATFDLPGAGWFQKGDRWRFDGALVGGPVKKAIVGPGTIIVKLTDTGLPLAGQLGTLGVRLTTGLIRQCAFFGPSTVSRNQTDLFRARGALASAIPDCTGASLGFGSPSGAFLD